MALISRFPAILFDFDGTLIDSAPEIAQALNALLKEYDRPPVTADQVRTFIGDGSSRLVERGFAATGGPVPADELAEAVKRYIAIYATVPADPDTIYPGVKETLGRLRDAGHKLALCTNKPESISRNLLDGLGLADMFTAVVGGDTLPQRKPQAEPLLHAIHGLGFSPDGAVMVGDNGNDVAAARAAGIPIVAVSYGYPRMPVSELGADRVIDRFADLPGALESLAG
ncbi:phosphoglycolate phosphatase [Indioceanicola profundi]|uniref:phosphoglycolate phosphatase n=1 Tax=Indioceanicola profundi TaxID=2220096 RepID=UPI000E6ACCB7|nr:phosphoglycolate phosphatase [Indioceanicola profundi]